LGKINNHQRREFCKLVDVENEKKFVGIAIQLENALDATAKQIKTKDKVYIKSAAEYTKLLAIQKKKRKEYEDAKAKANTVAENIQNLGINCGKPNHYY
jgi:hypothetical protein